MPQELVEWFSTFDGQAPGRSVSPPSLPRCRLLSLDEAINMKQKRRKPPLSSAGALWLPLAVTEDDELVIYFGGMIEVPGERPCALIAWLERIEAAW